MALNGLWEGARNWYDRFYRYCLSLGFTTAQGGPATATTKIEPGVVLPSKWMML